MHETLVDGHLETLDAEQDEPSLSLGGALLAIALFAVFMTALVIIGTTTVNAINAAGCGGG